MTTDIEIFTADNLSHHIKDLGMLLRACVQDGASIGFILPFSVEDSEALWRDNVLPALRGGKRILLVVRAGGSIAGAGQLDYDTPPNQPHRAEIRKLMVHPDFRRRGIAKALMAELEHLARELGRDLITLDTRTGDTAEPLYTDLGYQTAGIIPGYCRDAHHGHLDATTIMYKTL
ncbi:GNAT family N-acetyltransferase [Phyllobacterium sp. 628]|uniref:GNAT family N-acetyltransferase n=1 Tax=Phyllobacterium sp. 628 TaxID=2718938 RepID=UPI001662892D|nr:GNAT family N-acetyltransferase [Phyllobacterium sp. 628]QND52184.1 GNAT family N-acetyltransferase [Phyllobacterium sp. 628]